MIRYRKEEFMGYNPALNFEAQRQYIIDKTNGKLEYRDMIYCPDCKRITKHYFMKELNKEIQINKPL